MRDVDDGQAFEPEYGGSIGVGVCPGARFVRATVAHQVRCAGNCLVGLGGMGRGTLVPFRAVLARRSGDYGDVWFAGIPARDDFRRLQELLESTGSTLSTSADKRVPSAQA